MPTSGLRQLVTERLVAFAWDEWAQMGVFANARHESPWAADPEAYLVFTVQIARSDARLFNEVLDWLATNVQLLSVQRLRNMYAGDYDERLSEAALAWVAAHSDRLRLRSRPARSGSEPEPLLYGLGQADSGDEAFASYGFVGARFEPTKNSRRPDALRKVNLAFFLRDVFGVGSRAEIMRYLLTATTPSPFGSRPLFTALATAEAAGYAKRNVQDALNAFVEARVVSLVSRGNERLYEIDRERWQSALDVEIPAYRDWPHALLAMRELHRWLWRADLDQLSPYMRASEARRLMEQIEPALRYAGVAVPSGHAASGADYWDAFEHAVEQILDQFESGLRS